MNEEEVKSFIEAVADMRRAQEKYTKTLSYGYRRHTIILGSRVDKMLDNILGEGWKNN